MSAQIAYDPFEADAPPLWRRLEALVVRLFAVLLALCLALLLVFRFIGPFGSFTMLERRLEGETIKRDYVSISKISPNLIRAVIAAEDSRFCSHAGLDFEAIEKAVEEKERRGRLRGASTLTQQTAKNVFLWNGGGWPRKGAETGFALLIDAMWTKRRIMEVYLNQAEWGDGIFGAEAAAQARFGVSASDLSPWRAALLAAVLPSPNKWRVDPPGAYVQERARQIMGRMNSVAGEGLDACVLGRS